MFFTHTILAGDGLQQIGQFIRDVQQISCARTARETALLWNKYVSIRAMITFFADHAG